MTKRILVLAILVPLLVVASACKEEPPPPQEKPKPPPPPPPSAEELAQEALLATAPMMPYLQPEQGEPPAEVGTQVLAQLGAAKAKLRSQENWQKAQGLVGGELKRALKTIQEEPEKRWDLILLLCDAVELFDPQYRPLAALREQADLEKNCPQVTITGHLEDPDTKQVYFFVDVYLPRTDETLRLQIVKGQEFLDPPDTLTFEEILGTLKGIRLRYHATGEVFDVIR